VNNLAKHLELPKVPDRLSQLSVSALDEKIKVDVANASRPLPSIVVFSGHGARHAWFNFQGYDEEHARALGRCFPDCWGKQSWKEEKDGSWTLKIRPSKKIPTELRKEMAEAGRIRSENLVSSCQALLITDDEFLEEVHDENSLVRRLWNSGVKFASTGSLSFQPDQSSHSFDVAYQCVVPLINDKQQPILAYMVAAHAIERHELFVYGDIHKALRECCGVSANDGPNVADLLIAWCLKPEHDDPLSAAEIVMRELERPGLKFVDPKMNVAVARHLAKFLTDNPGHKLADLRSRYASSANVQEWLDGVEAALKH
jgi:hypothetical protein